MKLTKEKAAHNRQRIIETAGRLFRQHGFDGVGVADLMKAAGFTHGGFYNHSGLNNSNSKLSDALLDAESSDRSGLAKFVESYLSSEHRDDRAGGCTLASLACDAARETRDIQASFAKGIEEELGIFASYFAKSASEDQGSQLSAREQAIWLMAELVGTVILARAIARANPSLSDEILQTSRRMLLKRLDAARLPSRPRKKRI